MRTLTIICVVSLVVLAAVGVAGGTQANVGESNGSGELLHVAGLAAVATFLAGSLLLLVAVEVLIHALVRTATRFGISALVLAILVSGTEVDNVAFGVFTGFRELQHVAFGLAIGNAISIFGLTLALAALVYPFEVEVPTDYLAIMVLSPLALVPALLAGRLTSTYGVALIAAFVVLFGYVAYREHAGGRSYMRSGAVMEASTSADGEATRVDGLPRPVRRLARHRWFWPLVLLLALGGIVLGADVASAGVEGIIDTWHLGQTFVGVTLVTFVFTIDDVLLTVEPIRLGYYDVGVGGVIGSLLFFVTANAGIIGLVGTISTGPATIAVHFPMLVGMTALAGYLLWRGRLSRTAGAVLLGAYLVYLAVTVLAFATVPVSG